MGKVSDEERLAKVDKQIEDLQAKVDKQMEDLQARRSTIAKKIQDRKDREQAEQNARLCAWAKTQKVNFQDDNGQPLSHTVYEWFVNATGG